MAAKKYRGYKYIKETEGINNGPRDMMLIFGPLSAD